jgi:exoribonuclease R
MNSICGEWLNAKGVGIFREVSLNKMEDPEPSFPELPANTKTLLRNWKNVTGKYVWCDQVAPIKHEMMQIDSYVHITSPIRRLVDLLNQIIFQREFGLVEIVSREAEEFLDEWRPKMDEINTAMRSIRKAQIDCDWLFRCNAHPEWMQHPHRGVIFDRIEKPDGNYSYTVHLSDLNILGRIVTQEKYVNYHLLTFRLFVFNESDTLNRKIRLAVVN